MVRLPRPVIRHGCAISLALRPLIHEDGAGQPGTLGNLTVSADLSTITGDEFPMRTKFDKKGLKQARDALRGRLKENGVTINDDQACEALAAVFGVKDWNTLSALAYQFEKNEQASKEAILAALYRLLFDYALQETSVTASEHGKLWTTRGLGLLQDVIPLFEYLCRHDGVIPYVENLLDLMTLEKLMSVCERTDIPIEIRAPVARIIESLPRFAFENEAVVSKSAMGWRPFKDQSEVTKRDFEYIRITFTRLRHFWRGSLANPFNRTDGSHPPVKKGDQQVTTHADAV